MKEKSHFNHLVDRKIIMFRSVHYDDVNTYMKKMGENFFDLKIFNK